MKPDTVFKHFKALKFETAWLHGNAMVLTNTIF